MLGPCSVVWFLPSQRGMALVFLASIHLPGPVQCELALPLHLFTGIIGSCVYICCVVDCVLSSCLRNRAYKFFSVCTPIWIWNSLYTPTYEEDFPKLSRSPHFKVLPRLFYCGVSLQFLYTGHQILKPFLPTPSAILMKLSKLNLICSKAKIFNASWAVMSSGLTLTKGSVRCYCKRF